MKSKNKNLFIIGLALFLLLFLPASNTYAALFDISGIASNVVGNVFYFISYALSTIGGILFAFAAFLTNFAMQLNLHVFGDTNQLAKTGWTISRDLANLGFVLVIIVIAFSTILRLSEYGNQKMLFRLIAAAILVNFSFAVASIFIDFSNTITYFFLNKVSPGANVFGLASALAGAFNPQSLFGTGTFVGNEDSNVLSVILTGIQSLVFVTVFTLAGAFTLLAIAGMLLLRYLHLTFLIIIAPIVWLFWIIPQLSGQFGRWWNSFFRWTFFAPASMFFVYLALVSAEGLSNQNIAYISGGTGILGSIADSIKGVLDKGAQMVVLIGILIGGLIIADQMGIEGAKGAVKGATLVAKGSAKIMGRSVGRTAGTIAARTPGVAPAARGLNGLAGRLRNFATGTPPTAGVFRKGLGQLAGRVGAGLQGAATATTGAANRSLMAAAQPGSLISSLASTMKKGIFTGLGIKEEKEKSPRTIKEFEEAIKELKDEIENEEDDGEKTALTADLDDLEKGLEKLRQAAARRAAGTTTPPPAPPPSSAQQQTNTQNTPPPTQPAAASQGPTILGPDGKPTGGGTNETFGKGPRENRQPPNPPPTT